MSTTLPLFWNLASASTEERLEASVKLVHSLQQFQEAFIESSAEPSHSATDEDALEKYNAPDVTYTVRRLIRGLASPRESSRIGFAVALTELLSRLETFQVTQIIDLIIFSSEVQGSMSGQEKRDMMFARLFGFTCVIESGLLCRNPTAPHEDKSTEEHFLKVINELVLMGAKKAWLRESAWWCIYLAFNSLHGSSVNWKLSALSTVIQDICVDAKTFTPEIVALLLRLQLLFPQESLLFSCFRGGNILHPSHIGELGKILKEEADDEVDSEVVVGPSSSAWRPQLHFVWDALLDHYFTAGGSTESKAVVGFASLFLHVVDEGFFANTASSNRKYRGFQVLQRCLSRVPEDVVPILFTKNLMRSWINSLSSNDRYLHKMAMKLAQDLQKAVADRPRLGFPIIMTLLGSNGSHQFDKLTRTNTVGSIVQSLTAEDVRKFVIYLKEQWEGQGGSSDGSARNVTSDSLDAKRAWCLDQMGAVLRHASAQVDDQTIHLVLEHLIVHGHFVVKKKTHKNLCDAFKPTQYPVTSDISIKCRARLLNCLGDLFIDKSAGKPATSVSSATGLTWLVKTMDILQRLAEDEKHFSPLWQMDEQTTELCNKCRLLASASPESDVDQSCRVLFSGTLIYLHNSNNPDLDKESLQDCIDALSTWHNTVEGSSKNSGTPNKNALDAEAAEIPVDVIVDLVISYLDKESFYLRTIASKAFASLCGSLQESSIDLIVAQLGVPHTPSNEMDAETDTNSTENDPQSADSEDSDGDEDDSVSSNAASTSEDDVTEEPDAELWQKIEGVLGPTARSQDDNDTDEKDSSQDSTSSDEELLDDDQMLQFDEKLAEVFRLRRAERTNIKDKDTLHFKNRVLDLIDIFMRKEPTSRHMLSFITPLIGAILGAKKDDQTYSDKIAGIIRSRLSKPRDIPTGDSNPSSSDEILRWLHDKARKASSQDHLAIISICSLYIGRVLAKNSRPSVVVSAYEQSLRDFSGRKASRFNPAFFSEFCKRLPTIAWELRDPILQSAQTAVNGYRKAHIYQWLPSILMNLTLLDHREQVAHFVKRFCSSICDTVASTISGDGDANICNTAQLKDIIKAAVATARITQKSASSSGEQLWDTERLETIKRSLEASSRFKSSGVATGWNALRSVIQPKQKASGHSKTNGVLPVDVHGSPADIGAADVANGKASKRPTKGIKRGISHADEGSQQVVTTMADDTKRKHKKARKQETDS